MMDNSDQNLLLPKPDTFHGLALLMYTYILRGVTVTMHLIQNQINLIEFITLLVSAWGHAAE
jgi:hypothetical protein